MQSTAESLDEIRGTPRYLTGSKPSCMCSSSSKRDFIMGERPEQKKELFDGFAFNPENFSNSNKTAFTLFIEGRLASENK
jgi:hypothetical protein